MISFSHMVIWDMHGMDMSVMNRVQLKQYFVLIDAF